MRRKSKWYEISREIIRLDKNYMLKILTFKSTILNKRKIVTNKLPSLFFQSMRNQNKEELSHTKSTPSSGQNKNNKI